MPTFFGDYTKFKFDFYKITVTNSLSYLTNILLFFGRPNRQSDMRNNLVLALASPALQMFLQ